MTAPSLNLLNHPRQTWQAWSLPLAWGLLGLALALLLGWWWQAQRADLLLAHRHWRAQSDQQAALLVQAQQRREQQRRQDQQMALGHKLQAQQRRVLAVQTVLQDEASSGLRLWRWQADGQQLVLQGQLPRAEDLPRLQARLGQAWDQPWTLHSLGDGSSAAGLVWTLHAPWPVASSTQVTP